MQSLVISQIVTRFTLNNSAACFWVMSSLSPPIGATVTGAEIDLKFINARLKALTK